MSYREFWITQHALRFISVTWSPRNRPWDIVNYGWFWIISLENQSRWLITVICEFDLSGQPRSDEEKKRYERLTDSNKKFGVNLTFIFWGFKYENNELKSNSYFNSHLTSRKTFQNLKTAFYQWSKTTFINLGSSARSILDV